MGAFASYMRDFGKEWVDFVCYACHSNSVSVPEFFDILPPESRRILLYPEITMVDNWGTIGAMPIVEQFAYSIKRRFDIGRLCIENGGWINVGMHWLNADLPVAFNPATMYGAVCGTFTYSEGIHDDLNKVMWLSYGFSPLHKPEDVRLEYSRFYFGEEAAFDAAEAMRIMEKHSLLRCSIAGFGPSLKAAGKLGEEMAEKEEQLMQKLKQNYRNGHKGLGGI